MQDPPSPRDPAVSNLSIDPVIGWRLWRLVRGPDGLLRLSSPMRTHTWEPLHPARAVCFRTGHKPPADGCMCGFYATASLNTLPTAAAFDYAGYAVVGSVALWGRLIEHVRGYRAEFAYPDRLRVICGPCFGGGRVGAPERVSLLADTFLAPVCDAHASEALPPPLPEEPDALQAELLSTYAVDLLPREVMTRSGFLAKPPLPVGSVKRPPPVSLVKEAKSELRQLRDLDAGKVGLLALVVAYIVLRALGVFSSVSAPEPVAEPTIVDFPSLEIPLPSVPEPAPAQEGEAATGAEWWMHRTHRVAICGHLDGTTVELRDCGRPGANVFGTAVSPPEHRADCEFGDGFTRRDLFSVCWLGPLELILEEDDVLHIWQLPKVHWRDIGS